MCNGKWECLSIIKMKKIYMIIEIKIPNQIKSTLYNQVNEKNLGNGTW